MAGRGSVESRGKGTWRLTVSLGLGPDGNYIKKRKTVKAKNKTEARLLLNEFIIELEAGEYIDPSKIKLNDFLEEWKNKYAYEHLSPNTLETYEVILNAYILPVFGNKRLDVIKTIQIVNYLESLKTARRDGKEGGLSSASIQYHYRVLNNVFSRAVEWKMIKINPVEGLKKPKVEKTKTDVYTTDEVHELFKLLENEPIHQRLIITLAITCGLRRGEILGLQWKDIDFDKNTIHIVHSLYYTKEEGYQLKEPKTKTSERSIIAPNYVMDELKKYYHEKKKERLQSGELWEGGQYFFVFSTWNGKPFFPTFTGTWWRRFLDRTGFKKIRFHDLRHTAATLLINQGLHPKIISERLGHADIKTTMNIYGHYLKEADQQAANKLDDLFGPTKGTQ